MCLSFYTQVPYEGLLWIAVLQADGIIRRLLRQPRCSREVSCCVLDSATCCWKFERGQSLLSYVLLQHADVLCVNVSHLILKSHEFFQVHWTPHWSKDPTRDCCTLTAVDARIGWPPTRGTPSDFCGANARATSEPGEVVRRRATKNLELCPAPPVRSGPAGIAHLWSSGTWNIPRTGAGMPNATTKKQKCNAWPRPPFRNLWFQSDLPTLESTICCSHLLHLSCQDQ